MPDVERDLCFCWIGLMGDVHYCARHGGGVDERLPAHRFPVDAFEPHPVILEPVVSVRAARVLETVTE